jgi:hypothetical protein
MASCALMLAGQLLARNPETSKSSGTRMKKASVADPGSSSRQRASLQRLAYMLDSSIPLPGGFRIGLDGLIGLIPGIGDLIGAILSSYIIGQAYRMGVSRMILLHMAGNVALETVVGAIPIVGDLFDFAWKANRRNVALLEHHLADPGTTGRRSTILMILVIAGLVLLAAAVVYAMLMLLGWLIGHLA